MSLSVSYPFIKNRAKIIQTTIERLDLYQNFILSPSKMFNYSPKRLDNNFSNSSLVILRAITLLFLSTNKLAGKDHIP